MRIQPYNLFGYDLRMPGFDGMSVTTEARRIFARLPVIVITGFSTQVTAINVANIGVSGYLAKPLNVPKILEVATRALSE